MFIQKIFLVLQVVIDKLLNEGRFVFERISPIRKLRFIVACFSWDTGCLFTMPAKEHGLEMWRYLKIVSP